MAAAAARAWRAGDTVFHRPSGETWTIAYVDGDRLAWCGWPEGEALVSDCELVARASDEEHLDILHRCAAIRDGADRRGHMAIAALRALGFAAGEPECRS